MKSIYDKIAMRGVGELSDMELLAVVIEDKILAEKLISNCGSLSSVANTEIPRLRMMEGLGLRRAEKIVVSSELGRRLALAKIQYIDSITTSDDVVRIFRPIFDALSHEECWVLFLSNSNRIIERLKISQGGIQATVVDNRLIIKRALELLATQIILVHNHPSGSAEASKADIELTRKVRDAATLFDIRLLDHIIVAGANSFSFRSEGLL